MNLRSNTAMAMQATNIFPILKSSTLHWFDYTAMTSLSIVLNYTHSAELCRVYAWYFSLMKMQRQLEYFNALTK